MISKINLILCEIVSWDVPKFGGDLPSVYAYHIFFSPPPSVIARVCQNFPITVCGINLSQQTVSLLAILQ